MDLKKWEWMAKSTPQTEWIRRKGLLLWLAFFLIELGAGMYFVSFFLDNLWGMFIGWLICLILGGGTHLLYLGKPLRFWRMVINYTGEGGLRECLLSLRHPLKFGRMLLNSGWKTSWISRGLIFVGLFAIIGAIHLGLYKWAGAGTAYPLGIVMAVVSFLVTVYGGFAMNYSNAIPLWNTALLPILFVACSFWGGAELALATVMGGIGGPVTMESAEEWIRIGLISYIFLMIVYLWTIRYGMTVAGKHAVSQILRGRMSPVFYLGAVGIGMLVPLAAVISSFAMGIGAVPVALLGVAIACGLIGDLSMRYCLLTCGYYAPVIPVSTY